MFKFTVSNLPSEATYWAAAFEIGGQNYWPGILKKAGEYQDYPVAGPINSISIYLYDGGQNYLGPSYARSLYYGYSVSNDISYTYNWASGKLAPSEYKVDFAINQVFINPQYINLGDTFVVTFDFNYSGPEIVGGIGLKVALGTDGFLGFNEVKPVWYSVTNVYKPGNYTANVSCQVPAEFTPKIYDISCEIGQYPWKEGTVYGKPWRMKEAVNVLKVGQVPPGPEPTPPSPPPSDGELGNWAPWIMVAGAVLFLYALVRRPK